MKKAMKKTAKELDHMAQGWLEEHKQRKISGGIKEHQDFLDVMLSIVTDEDEISSYDADIIIKATCLVRLFIFKITVLIHIYIIYYWLFWMSWILRT